MYYADETKSFDEKKKASSFFNKNVDLTEKMVNFPLKQ